MKEKHFVYHRLLLVTVLYSVLSVAAFWISAYFTLGDKPRYEGNNLTTIMTFVILVAGIILFLLKAKNIKRDSSLGFMSAAGLVFALHIGLFVFIFTYISVTVVEPEYLEKALATARASWEASGYTEEKMTSDWKSSGLFRDATGYSLLSAMFLSVTALLASFLFSLGYGLRNLMRYNRRIREYSKT